MKDYDMFSDYDVSVDNGNCRNDGRSSPELADLGLSPKMAEPHVYSVSELNNEIAGLFGNRYAVTVQGELSNCGNNRRGSYFYCIIKDAENELSVAFPSGVIQHQFERIRDGVTVVISGRVSFYRPKGKVTLWGSSLKIQDRPGDLYRAFLKTLELLRSEGLFDIQSKKPIPANIHTVGIITSPDGMAVKDVIRTIKRRNRFINIVVYPAIVQGSMAVQSIKYALWYANRHNVCQVLLVVRGGGSVEDLSCFNDEGLARYTKMSVIPVISGVGHEGDVTIMDYIADMRASTPTAAAEMVSASLDNSIERLAMLKRRLWNAGTGRIGYERQRLNAVRAGFCNYAPEKRLSAVRTGLQELQGRMRLSLIRALQVRTAAFNAVNERFNRQNPKNIITEYSARCSLSGQKMLQLMEMHLKELRHRLVSGASLLNANNPLKILTQGYSVTLDESGKGVTVSGVGRGDRIRTILADGEIVSEVTDTVPGNPVSDGVVSEKASDLKK